MSHALHALCYNAICFNSITASLKIKTSYRYGTTLEMECSLLNLNANASSIRFTHDDVETYSCGHLPGRQIVCTASDKSVFLTTLDKTSAKLVIQNTSNSHTGDWKCKMYIEESPSGKRKTFESNTKHLQFYSECFLKVCHTFHDK